MSGEERRICRSVYCTLHHMPYVFIFLINKSHAMWQAQFSEAVQSEASRAFGANVKYSEPDQDVGITELPVMVKDESSFCSTHCMRTCNVFVSC